MVSTSSRSVYLQWNPPQAHEQNGLITSYTITWTEVLTGEMYQLSTNSTGLTLSGLLPYTTYDWRVAAWTSIGMGPFSTTVNLLMPEDGNPT